MKTHRMRSCETGGMYRNIWEFCKNQLRRCHTQEMTNKTSSSWWFNNSFQKYWSNLIISLKDPEGGVKIKNLWNHHLVKKNSWWEFFHPSPKPFECWALRRAHWLIDQIQEVPRWRRFFRNCHGLLKDGFCLPLRNPRVGYSNLKRIVKYCT